VEAKKSGWVYPNMKQVNLRGYQVSSITEAIAQLPAKGSSSIVRPRKYRVQGEFYPPHRYQEALENPDRQSTFLRNCRRRCARLFLCHKSIVLSKWSCVRSLRKRSVSRKISTIEGDGRSLNGSTPFQIKANSGPPRAKTLASALRIR